MTARQIETFRKILKAREAELTQRAYRIRESLAAQEQGDSLDRLRILNDRDAAVRDLIVLTSLLQGIREALREIRVGTFGVCAGCDREIPLRRLQAVPWSPYCIECQEMVAQNLPSAGKTAKRYFAQAG